jgi:hypothetical protein
MSTGRVEVWMLQAVAGRLQIWKVDWENPLLAARISSRVFFRRRFFEDCAHLLVHHFLRSGAYHHHQGVGTSLAEVLIAEWIISEGCGPRRPCQMALLTA